VERISRIEVTDEEFEIPGDFTWSEFAAGPWVAGGSPSPVAIAFDAKMAGYIRERVWHESQSLEERPDGSVVLAHETSRSLRAEGLDQELRPVRPSARDPPRCATRSGRPASRAVVTPSVRARGGRRPENNWNGGSQNTAVPPSDLPNRHPGRDYTSSTRPRSSRRCAPRRASPTSARSASATPDRRCVELKSLKLYLQSYRDRGIFYEHVVNVILDA